MSPYNGPHTINHAAPLHLSPERLLLTLQQHASWIGSPKLCVQSGRTLKNPSFGTCHTSDSASSAIRALTTNGSPSSNDAPLSSDESSAWFLYALSQRATDCFFCQEDGHLLKDCSKFTAIKDNSFARKQIRRLLDPLSLSACPPSSFRPGASYQPPPTQRLGQVVFSLAGAADSESGEGDSASSAEADPEDDPDFL
jgi:hypothetical protein